jgi:hypothetical protein
MDENDLKRLQKNAKDREKQRQRRAANIQQLETINALNNVESPTKQPHSARARASAWAKEAKERNQVIRDDDEVQIMFNDQLQDTAEGRTDTRRTQINRAQATSRARKESLDFKWSQLCKFGCGCVHLDVATASELKRCCYGGKIMQNKDLYDRVTLEPLSYEYLEIYGDPAFGRSSSMYNNMLSFGAVKVMNDQGVGGFEKIVGDHSVTLNGRTHHFIPPGMFHTYYN